MKPAPNLVASLSFVAALLALVLAASRARPFANATLRPPIGADRAAGSVGTGHAGSFRVATESHGRNQADSFPAAAVTTEMLAGRVRDDFERRWQVREAEMQQKYMRGAADSDALAAFALEHDIRLEVELRAALGPAEFRRWDEARVLRSFDLGRIAISPRERDHLYDLERGLQDDLRRVALQKLRGEIDPATSHAREEAAQDDAAGELRTLLGEQRVARLLSDDSSLQDVKRALAPAPLSDVQLNALAETQRRWDETRSRLAELQNNTGDPACAGAIRDAEEKWREEFQRIAGPEAFDQFQKAQDSRYADLRKLAAGRSISPGQAENVFTAIENYDQVVRDYALDAQSRDADPAAAQFALQNFRTETERSLQEQLGAAKFAELKREGIVP